MFRASLCRSSGEQRPCYCIWCIVLVLLDVFGSGCGGAVLQDVSTSATKHVEKEVNNKHLIVASGWFFSLHTSMAFVTTSLRHKWATHFRASFPIIKVKIASRVLCIVCVCEYMASFLQSFF